MKPRDRENMSARPRKSTVLFIAACAIIGPANAAKAEPLHYTVTDLGSGYQLQADANGHASSVAGAGGGPGYVFDKSPTAQVYERQDGSGLRYSVTTLRNGQFTAGYHFNYGGPMPPVNFAMGHDPNYSKWNNYGGRLDASELVSDLNSRGQYVGTSTTQSLLSPIEDPNEKFWLFAAFTAPNQRPPIGWEDRRTDLNNYIPKELGVYLSSALKIDDLGQIIARGFRDENKGDPRYFLLTPYALPTPIPEPSTLAVLGAGLAALVLRSKSRRARKAAKK